MAISKNISKKIESLYSSINSESHDKFNSGRYDVDPFLNAPETDQRLGITLLIPLSGALTHNFIALENDIHAIEPDQYFYPESDLHVTVLDLISARDDFKQSCADIGKFIRLIQKAVTGITPFRISFKGVILSGNGILVKGYYVRGLQDIRGRMREMAIANNIDFQERYQSISAHATIVRFKSTIKNWLRLRAFMKRERRCALGVMTVKELHLVIHDWYNRKKEVVGTFVL
jgi:hypothetical protein